MEIIVATIVAVIAIVALAYTFGIGRGLVNRYEAARVALAAAQRRMERLAASPPTSPDLQIPTFPSTTYGPFPVQVDGRVVAYESWTVEAYDDPADGSHTGTDLDLKRVTVSVTWGGRGPNETVTLTRLFPLY
jgi:type II secretory pathway pseudopilin PulG